MKLLRLLMDGFGPYGEETVVDFRPLRLSRLFLIHGPVGSGKTFLLDGICFALYGRSSGGERDRAGLRSISRLPEEDTVVSLDFESHGQTYRVERRFNAAAMARGDEEVVLWRLPEIGNPTRRDIVSSSLGGVEAMVAKLFGLSADQFCQVAILPQGRFRQFLLTEGENRRQILSNMFQSARHARLQSALAKECQTARSRLEDAWRRREELTAEYGQNNGDPRESLARFESELQAMEKSCRHHQERSVEWEKSLEEAVRFEVLDRQRDISERELRILHDEEDDTEEAIAARLRKSLPDYERWRDLCEQADGLEEELKAQRRQYESLKSNTNYLEEEVERARRLEEERFNLKRSLERLDHLVDDYRGINILTEELERTEDRLDDLAHRRGELAQGIKEDKARIEELEGELATIKEAEGKLSRLRADLEAVSEQRGRARQNELLQESVQQARAREERLSVLVDQLKGEREELKQKLSKQKEREVEDALFLLQSRLQKGEECPLCGSLEHPDPYNARRRRRRGGEEDENGLETLKRRIEVAVKELALARERKARLEGRLEERVFESPDGLDLDDRTLRSLKQTADAVEVKIAGKESLLRELRELRERIKPERVKLKKMRLLKERLEGTLESLATQKNERESSLLQTLRELFPHMGQASYGQLTSFVSTEKSRLDERLQEIAQVRFTTERAELMAETFALQLAETRQLEIRRDSLRLEAEGIRRTLEERFRLEFSGWEDLNFSLSRLSRETTVNSQAGLLDRETLIATVQRQLSQSQELLATLPQPEMKAEQIRAALAREREQLEVKVGRRAALEKSVERSADDVGRYDALVEEIRELETRTGQLESMNRLASGEQGLDFHDWYLERLFRRVIEAANLRLEILAPNRFCLGLQQGLEVVVVDFGAAKERSATTLSGGESFLASLALALGLGDLLQGDRASRERLQTLFIDEGFGYLDRRALEAAMDCLESLKQEGRTVGLISHVGALRDRIRAQVVVAANDSPLPYGTERIQVFAE